MKYANPFVTWTTLVEGLHNRFAKGLTRDVQGYVESAKGAAILQRLTTLRKELQQTGVLIDDLEFQDKAAYDAFLQALENS